jgi:hypothetical protein
MAAVGGINESSAARVDVDEGVRVIGSVRHIVTHYVGAVI